MAISVSVVVPTYCRNDLLRRCLEALIRQDLPATEYEVIVADNAGDPATEVLVSAFNAVYVKANHARGPAAARNAGWRIARGEVIAFTDDDCVPEPGWLTAGLRAMEQAAAAASGAVRMPLPFWPTYYERDAAGLASSEFVTANCFCRKSALQAIGGFDERFTGAWREDSDLQFSLLEAEMTIVRAPEAIVVHPIRPAPWGICLCQETKTRFDPLLYKKHPQLYRQRVPRLPLDYYVIVASLSVSLVAPFAGWWPFFAAGLAVWLLLTARLCLRRLAGNSRHPSHVAEVVVTSLFVPLLSLYWRLRGLLEYRTLYV
jgi:glycosyltransferase involved in cell wall biosynthesis